MAAQSFDVFGRVLLAHAGRSPSAPGGRVVLVPSDGGALEFDAEVAFMSLRVRQLAGSREPEARVELPLKKRLVKKVFEYCRHYARSMSPVISTPLAGDTADSVGMSPWDMGFLASMDVALLFEVMVAASYLEVADLVHLLGIHAALLVQGKSTDRLRKEFGLAKDLPEDEEQDLAAAWSEARRRHRPSAPPSGVQLDSAAVVMQQLAIAAQRTGVPWEEPAPPRPQSFRGACWRAAVAQDWRLLARAPAEVRGDAVVVRGAVEASGGEALRWASEALRAEPGVVLRAVELGGAAALEAAAVRLRDDADFLLQAVARNGGALAAVPAQLRADHGFMRRAACAAASAPGEVRSACAWEDRDFALECVALAPEVLRVLPPELREDRAFALAAAGRCGASLRYMEAKWRADRDVVAAAVANNPEALSFAHTARRTDMGASGASSWSHGALQPAMGHVHAQRHGALKCGRSVNFSAVSTMMANMGQANYIASNAFLDKLPARQRPEVDAVTLMWGPVGSIGMRWRAFASADMLGATPEALLSVRDASQALKMTCAWEVPEWYACQLLDEQTRQAILSPYSGGGTGGGWTPAETRAPRETEPRATESRAPREPLSGWAELRAPAPGAGPIAEGCRVRLRGVGGKSGAEGVATQRATDGRWRVQLDGPRAGSALLAERFLVALGPGA